MMSDNWTVDGTSLGKRLSEIRTWDSLELVFRYEKEETQNVIEQIRDISGKGSLKELTFGGFRSVDVGGGDNLFKLEAPEDEQNVRPVNEWYVDDYSIELVDRVGEVFQLELDLIPEREKDIEGDFGTLDRFDPPEDDPDPNKFEFDFEYGRLVTRRVSVETTETPDGSIDVEEIQLVLFPDEVRLVEENLAKQNAVYSRNVPDGTDVLKDESRDERQTVSIVPPDGRDEPIPEDVYIVTFWETEWNGKSYNVTLELSHQ